MNVDTHRNDTTSLSHPPAALHMIISPFFIKFLTAVGKLWYLLELSLQQSNAEALLSNQILLIWNDRLNPQRGSSNGTRQSVSVMRGDL